MAERRALVVADALGTNPFFPNGDDRVGVRPLLKRTAAKLRVCKPEHLLVGHGGVHGPEAAIALRQALPLAALVVRQGVSCRGGARD